MGKVEQCLSQFSTNRYFKLNLFYVGNIDIAEGPKNSLYLYFNRIIFSMAASYGFMGKVENVLLSGMFIFWNIHMVIVHNTTLPGLM